MHCRDVCPGPPSLVCGIQCCAVLHCLLGALRPGRRTGAGFDCWVTLQPAVSTAAPGRSWYRHCWVLGSNRLLLRLLRRCWTGTATGASPWPSALAPSWRSSSGSLCCPPPPPNTHMLVQSTHAWHARAHVFAMPSTWRTACYVRRFQPVQLCLLGVHGQPCLHTKRASPDAFVALCCYTPHISPHTPSGYYREREYLVNYHNSLHHDYHHFTSSHPIRCAGSGSTWPPRCATPRASWASWAS